MGTLCQGHAAVSPTCASVLSHSPSMQRHIGESYTRRTCIVRRKVFGRITEVRVLAVTPQNHDRIHDGHRTKGFIAFSPRGLDGCMNWCLIVVIKYKKALRHCLLCEATHDEQDQEHDSQPHHYDDCPEFQYVGQVKIPFTQGIGAGRPTHKSAFAACAAVRCVQQHLQQDTLVQSLAGRTTSVYRSAVGTTLRRDLAGPKQSPEYSHIGTGFSSRSIR